MTTSQDTDADMDPNEFVNTMVIGGHDLGMVVDVLRDHHGNVQAAAAFLENSIGIGCVTVHTRDTCMLY